MIGAGKLKNLNFSRDVKKGKIGKGEVKEQ